MIKKNERLFWFYFLSFTWGIIWTVIGLVVFVFALIFTKKEKRDVLMYKGRIVICYPNARFGGISLGIVLIVSSTSIRLLNHELGHTIQNTWFGPFFILLIAIPSGIRYQLFDWLYDRHKRKYNKPLMYDSIWFEAQATRLGQIYGN